MYQNTINGCKILLQNEANAYKVYQKVKKDIKKEKNVFFCCGLNSMPKPTALLCFPYKLCTLAGLEPGSSVPEADARGKYIYMYI
jgi:hypothetical protein